LGRLFCGQEPELPQYPRGAADNNAAVIVGGQLNADCLFNFGKAVLVVKNHHLYPGPNFPRYNN